MILTGKALENFEKWYFENNCQSDISFEELMPHHKLDIYGWLYSQSDTMVNAFVIDWLDTVGIYISINYVDLYNETENKKGFEGYITYQVLSTKLRCIHSRKEATKAAIEKANELYNQRTIK